MQISSWNINSCRFYHVNDLNIKINHSILYGRQNPFISFSHEYHANSLWSYTFSCFHFKASFIPQHARFISITQININLDSNLHWHGFTMWAINYHESHYFCEHLIKMSACIWKFNAFEEFRIHNIHLLFQESSVLITSLHNNTFIPANHILKILSWRLNCQAKI